MSSGDRGGPRAGPQEGIFRERSRHHLFLEFRLRSDAAGPARLPGGEARAASPDGEVLEVVAFGPRLARSLEAVEAPEALRDFAFEGDLPPATQRDLFLWLHGDRRDEVFARGLAWRRALEPAATLVGEEHGFLFRDSRDLTGFVDGTANPKDDARYETALIADGACEGGSFVLAQRFVHDLDAFGALPVGDQERVIGRTKPDSIELAGAAMPPDSHVSRTDLKRDGSPVRIYRRSTPVGGLSDPGLYFLAFSADPERYRWLLDSMYGRSGDGRSDRLLRFTKPVTGSYFYAPPVQALAGAFAD